MALVRRQANGNGVNRSWGITGIPSVPSIFQEFDQLFDALAVPANRTVLANTYPVDLFETDDELVLNMAVPGMQAQDLDISVEGRQLTIRGNLPQQEGEGRRYWIQSIPTGSFERSLTLPAQVDLDSVQANVSQGMLTLRLPKAVQARARKITISEGS